MLTRGAKRGARLPPRPLEMPAKRARRHPTWFSRSPRGAAPSQLQRGQCRYRGRSDAVVGSTAGPRGESGPLVDAALSTPIAIHHFALMLRDVSIAAMDVVPVATQPV